MVGHQAIPTWHVPLARPAWFLQGLQSPKVGVNQAEGHIVPPDGAPGTALLGTVRGHGRGAHHARNAAANSTILVQGRCAEEEVVPTRHQCMHLL